MTKLLSFHNNTAIKTKYLSRLKAHAKADELVQGVAWENGKGCAVGCTLENYSHQAYETELGLPEWLAILEDAIFEGLNPLDAKQFAIDFLDSIPVGVNLDRVKWKFCVFILKENIERVLALNIQDDLKQKVVEAIQRVLALHEKASLSGEWDTSAAWSAWLAAESAAESAESVESAARLAAWSAAVSAVSAGSAAESAYSKYAEELIRLLKETK